MNSNMESKILNVEYGEDNDGMAASVEESLTAEDSDLREANDTPNNEIKSSAANSELDSRVASPQNMMTEISDIGFFSHGSSKSVKSKNITLDLLIRDGVLEPAERSLSVKYLGIIMTADLLENGKIRSNDTAEVFCTPSSWAISCKKSINPAKTSGCGWSSIRYKGKSLDMYKTKWMKNNMNSTSASPLSLTPAMCSGVSTPKLDVSASPSLQQQQLTVSRNSCSPLLLADVKPLNPTDLLYPAMSSTPLMNYEKHISTQVRCEGVEFSFKAIFNPEVCHTMAELSVSSEEEVSGYLAGSFNPHNNVLTVDNVYNKTDAEARTKVNRSGMVLVGWFHSHPTLSYYPSVYDVESHMNYQLRFRDQPLISCIIGKKDVEDDMSLSMLCYNVSPPKLKFSERFGCLSDKCGKPKLVHWRLTQPSTVKRQSAQKRVAEFMENISKANS